MFCLMTTIYNLKKIFFISLIVFFSPIPQSLFAVQLEFLSGPELVVRFEPPLKHMAEDVAKIYPPIKSDLEKTFGWKMPFRPTVFLIQHKEYFQ